ncbi:hypothetical protein [Geoalkalibacter subterraneus]|uniref:hypothetical protein n=1 Tax=Geoalkalibacter subterraneus TaxID=483547 RepID=UPI001186FAA7|nr:hypothetical protein [Geoalkalibacter subterraneus]
MTKHVFSLLIRVDAPAIVIAPGDGRYQEILTSALLSVQNVNLNNSGRKKASDSLWAGGFFQVMPIEARIT